LALGWYSKAGGANNNAGTIAIGSTAQAGTGAAGQTNATAVGMNAKANAASSLALGYNANASLAKSVAIGSGSVTTAANTVSVGSAGHERRIMNVAAATKPTDAVNLAQVQTMIAAAAHVAAHTPAPSPPNALDRPTRSSATMVRLSDHHPQLPANSVTPRGGSESQPAGNTSSPRGSGNTGQAAAGDEEALEPSTIVGWANVSHDGTLSGSRNIAGNARHGVGDYEIVFKKTSLLRCSYNATLAGGGVASVKVGPLANSLKVETRNHYGVLTDSAFYLMAVC
jgi:autotransporter adhesin